MNCELEWLCYQLWTKLGSAPPKFVFGLPDTVFFRYGRPEQWFFTNKEGYILKKNKFNVNFKAIHHAYMKKIQAVD